MSKFSKLEPNLLYAYAFVHKLPPVPEPILLPLLSKSEPIPIEPYVDALSYEGNEATNDLTDSGVARVIDLLGIVIPPDYDDKDYILDNIGHYAEMVANPPTAEEERAVREYTPNSDIDIASIIGRCTDKDIFSLVGAYFYYRSRPELVDRVTSFLRGTDKFLVPISVEPENRETYLGTDITSVPIVCYGSYGKIRAYEEDEFLDTCKIIRGRLSCSVPRTDSVLNKKRVKELLGLIEAYGIWPRLTKILKEGLEYRFPDIEDIKKSLAKLPSSQKIKEFLIELFYTGMTMRGWKSGRYPRRARETKGKELQEATTNRLNKLTNLYNSYDEETKELVDNLCLNNEDEYLNKGLMDRLIDIRDRLDDLSYIRVNRGYFIFTAYNYLKDLFDYSIPDFDPDKLDWI